MSFVKSILMAGAASLALTAAAQAADLPTTKGAPAPPPPPAAPASCTGFQDFLTTACPLTYSGITVYGTVDVGYGWEKFGAPWNKDSNFADNYLISKAGRANIWLQSPNALSQSNVGLKAKEQFAPGWYFVGQVETGFDPYSLLLANGPKSIAENTALPLAAQTSGGDSARAGQWDNSQALVGISNSTFGTLTYGRQNTLLLDGVNAYDPMGGSYAFSVIGFSGTTAGGGNTEDTRSNSAFKYRVEYNNFRAAGLAQVGGYAQGNGADEMYQGQVGFDAYGFSFDAIGGYANDSVKLGTFNATPTDSGFAPPPVDAVKATISNDTSVMLLGKYKWNQVTLYGGFEDIRYANPDNQWAKAGLPFTTLGGYYGVNQGDKFFTPEWFQVFWAGAKYAFTPDLVGTIAYYHYNQDYYMASSSSKPCSNNSASNCSGTEDAVSALIDYRFGFAQKFDIYGGVMWSEVNNGLANGYQKGGTVNIDPTVGLRFRF